MDYNRGYPHAGSGLYGSIPGPPLLPFCRNCDQFRSGPRFCGVCGQELRVPPVTGTPTTAFPNQLAQNYPHQTFAPMAYPGHLPPAFPNQLAQSFPPQTFVPGAHPVQPSRGRPSRSDPSQGKRDKNRSRSPRRNEDRKDRRRSPHRPQASKTEKGRKNPAGVTSDAVPKDSTTKEESSQSVDRPGDRAGVRWCNRCSVPTHWTSEMQYHDANPVEFHGTLLNGSVPEFSKLWDVLKGFNLTDTQWENVARIRPNNRRELIHHLYKMVEDIIRKYRTFAPQRDARIQEIFEQGALHATSAISMPGNDGHTPWEYYSAKANGITLSFVNTTLLKVHNFFDDVLIKTTRTVTSNKSSNNYERRAFLRKMLKASDANATGTVDWNAVTEFAARIENASEEYTQEMVNLNETWLALVNSNLVMPPELLQPECAAILSLPFLGMRACYDSLSLWLPTIWFPSVEDLMAYREVPDHRVIKTEKVKEEEIC